MNRKKTKNKERMQTQAKPSNRTNERNLFKTTDNISRKEEIFKKKENK